MKKQKNSMLFIILLFSLVLSPCQLIGMIITQEKDVISIVSYNDKRDRNAVVAILDAYPHYLRYETIGKPAGTTEKYLTTKNYFTYVLRKNDKTIGFINYSSYEKYFLTFYFGRQGLIHLMGVDSKNQKKGYGLLLLNHALNHLKELNTPDIMLTVKRDNVWAQKLYKKAGFEGLLTYQSMDDWFFTKKLNVDTSKHPRGNIIQRYPRTFCLTLLGSVAAIAYYAWRR